MGKELTEAQRLFIETYLIGKSEGERKKIEAAYLDFDRRREKIQAEIAKLKGDDAKLLGAWLKGAVARAEGGDFRGAYEALDEVKRNARALAQGRAKELPVEAVLQALRPPMMEIGNLTATAVAGMTQLIRAAAEHATPAYCKSYSAACAFRAQLTEEEAVWRGSLIAYQRQVERAAAIARQPMVHAVLGQVAATIDAMPPPDKRTALTRQIGEVVDLARQPGRVVSAQEIMANFIPQREAFEAALAKLKDFSTNLFTPEERGKFAELEQRQQALLGTAMARVAGAAGRDAEGLDPGKLGAAPAAPRPRPTFRLKELATGQVDDGPLEDATVKAMCDDLAKKMGEGEFGADRMLDLTLKTAAELEDELAAMAGLPKDRAAWGNNADPIAKAAEKLRQVMQQNNPNRRTGGKIVLNGKTYVREEAVAVGGMGMVERFTEETTGKTVIVKQVKYRGIEEQFVGEARAHWQLSGGGSGEGDPHVVKMNGAAVDDQGNLSIVMEEAKGGDLDVFANALNECCRMGIIPPAARNALTQDIARQAAEGLKAVHQQNDLHCDLKAKNFFVDENGKVVIGDFGGAVAMGEDGTVSGDIATTPRFAPPEYWQSGPYTTGTDVFMLGAMMQGLQSDIMVEGEEQRLRGGQGPFTQLRTNNEATAFDRVRNAMLDPDPAKRPSLDGVLASAYVSAAGNDFAQEDVAALMAAVARYSEAVGNAVLRLSETTNAGIGRDRKRAAAPGERAKSEAEDLAELRKDMAAINEQPEIKKLLEDIRKLSAPFGGTGARDAAAENEARQDAERRAADAGGGTAPKMAQPLQQGIRDAKGTPSAANDANPQPEASGRPRVVDTTLYNTDAMIGRRANT